MCMTYLCVLCRVPEAHFYIPLQHQLQSDPSGVCTLLPSQPPHAPKPSSPSADRGGLAGAAATPLPAPTAAAATDAAAAAAGDSSAAGGLTSTQQQQQQQAQEQGSTGGKVQKRAQKQQQQQVVVPGPEEICEPGMAWGTDDRWIEPWDEAAGEVREGQYGRQHLLYWLCMLDDAGARCGCVWPVCDNPIMWSTGLAPCRPLDLLTCTSAKVFATASRRPSVAVNIPTPEICHVNHAGRMPHCQ
jgi:hypothetical protein